MKRSSSQASEINFQGDSTSSVPQCSGQLNVDRTHHRGHTEAPNSPLAPPLYRAATILQSSNVAADYHQTTRVKALRAQSPANVSTRQNVETLSQNAARGATSGQAFPCKLCGYICSTESRLLAHWELCTGTKQFNREEPDARRKAHKLLGPQTPGKFRCTICSQVFVVEVFNAHMNWHLALQAAEKATKDGGTGRLAQSPAAAPVNTLVRRLPIARPFDTSVSSPPLVASPVFREFTPPTESPPTESPLYLDDLDYSDVLQFPSDEDQKRFDQLWDSTINDIAVTHFGDNFG